MRDADCRRCWRFAPRVFGLNLWGNFFAAAALAEPPVKDLILSLVLVFFFFDPEGALSLLLFRALSLSLSSFSQQARQRSLRSSTIDDGDFISR